MKLVFQPSIFRCYVSFRGCNPFLPNLKIMYGFLPPRWSNDLFELETNTFFFLQLKVDTGIFLSFGSYIMLHPYSSPIKFPVWPHTTATRFAYLEDPGWIQSPLTWGDNGRRRTFELCLDRLPVPMENVAIQDCQKVICLRNGEVFLWGLILLVFIVVVIYLQLLVALFVDKQ